MTADRAEQAVVTSAVLVSGIYFYRKLTGAAIPSTGTPAGAAGALLPRRDQQIAPVGKFLVGFAFAYMIISTIAMFAPGLGAMLAILLATGSVLANGLALFTDIQGRTA